MVRDNRHDSAYIFGAICPDRAVGVSIVMPAVNAEAMGHHLKAIAAEVTPGAMPSWSAMAQVGTKLAGDRAGPTASRCCPCHPTPRNRTQWRMPGATCAKTFSAPASGTPTTISSRHAASPGAFLPTTLNASDQSASAIGRVSAFKWVGITMKSRRICPCPRRRRITDRSSGTAGSPRSPSSADSIIGIVGCSYRQGHQFVGPC